MTNFQFADRILLHSLLTFSPLHAYWFLQSQSAAQMTRFCWSHMRMGSCKQLISGTGKLYVWYYDILDGIKIAFLTFSYCDFPSDIYLLWRQITSQLLCICIRDHSALWSRGRCHEPSGSTENWVGIDDC